MQIKIITPILVAVLAIVMVATMGTRASFTHQPSGTIVQRLSKNSWHEDQILLAKRWEARRIFAAALIVAAKSPQIAKRASAMYMLGLYRIARAVPMLATNIQFRHMFKNSMLPVRGTSRYPAMQALIRIGTPAIPVMVKNLETTEKPEVAACSAWVIRKVEGRRLGACVIKIALQNKMPLLEKARLRAAMAAIDSNSWRWDAWSSIKLPANIKWPEGVSEK